MGSTELIANLFRISQTEEKLRKDEVDNAKTATSIHYSVGKEVRSAIEKIGGTMPEDLPTPEKTNTVYKCLRTARIQDQKVGRKTLLKLGESYEEIRLDETVFPVVNEEYLCKRDQLISKGDFKWHPIVFIGISALIGVIFKFEI